MVVLVLLEFCMVLLWQAKEPLDVSYDRFRFQTGSSNHPFVDVKPKAVWSFVLHQTKTGYQTDQTTLGCALFGLNVHFKIKYGGNRTLSWNSLRRNDCFSQNVVAFYYLCFLVWHIGVCQIISFAVKFDCCTCHGDHDYSKLCIYLRQWNRFETKTVNLNRVV